MENRTTIHVPKDSKLYKFLEKHGSKPKWEVIEELLSKEPETKEDWADKIFEEFVARISIYYPEKKAIVKKFWALIIWKVIYGEPLTKEYIKEIEKIMHDN